MLFQFFKWPWNLNINLPFTILDSNINKKLSWKLLQIIFLFMYTWKQVRQTNLNLRCFLFEWDCNIITLKNGKRNCTSKPHRDVIDIIILSPYILMIRKLQERENGIKRWTGESHYSIHNCRMEVVRMLNIQACDILV